MRRKAEVTKTPAAVGCVRSSPETDPAGLGRIDWQAVTVAVCRSLCPHVVAVVSNFIFHVKSSQNLIKMRILESF